MEDARLLPRGIGILRALNVLDQSLLLPFLDTHSDGLDVIIHSPLHHSHSHSSQESIAGSELQLNAVILNGLVYGDEEAEILIGTHWIQEHVDGGLVHAHVGYSSFTHTRDTHQTLNLLLFKRRDDLDGRIQLDATHHEGNEL